MTLHPARLWGVEFAFFVAAELPFWGWDFAKVSRGTIGGGREEVTGVHPAIKTRFEPAVGGGVAWSEVERKCAIGMGDELGATNVEGSAGVRKYGRSGRRAP